MKKIKKHIIDGLGIEVWNNFEGVFLDPESPAFNELTKEEFGGLIKGLNIMFDILHFSTNSKEFKAVRKKAEAMFVGVKCSKCGEQVGVKSVCMGQVLGFNEFCDCVFKGGKINANERM